MLPSASRVVREVAAVVPLSERQGDLMRWRGGDVLLCLALWALPAEGVRRGGDLRERRKRVRVSILRPRLPLGEDHEAVAVRRPSYPWSEIARGGGRANAAGRL